MVNRVGFRFRPTDEELVEHYLRRKNLGKNTSHVDRVINTVDICSVDPWGLPSRSRIKSRDLVWYFFGRKDNKYNRGEKQSRKTSSGFWKKTGKTMEIIRKRSGNREKIGEKRVLVFKLIDGSKTKWVMHEYQSNQMMATYTVCKVMFKGEEREISSYSGGEITSQELHNPCQFSGFLGVEEETQLQDAMRRAINNLSNDEWKSLINDNNDDDDEKQSKIVVM